MRVSVPLSLVESLLPMVNVEPLHEGRLVIDELDALLEGLYRNNEIRVLIVTGGGDKGFCSGMDMQESAAQLFAASPEMIYTYQNLASRLFYKMRLIPQPVIAAVHGAASGAGFSFAMASDVRLITPQARFNASYINIGLGGADLASSYFLPKMIGSGRANEFFPEHPYRQGVFQQG